MAIQKQISLNFSITNNGLYDSLSLTSSEAAVGTDSQSLPQAVPTSWTALNIGACSPAGLIAVRNVDGTNFVQLATANDGTGIFAKLKAGRVLFLPVDPSATIYIKANTATCVCLVMAVED